MQGMLLSALSFSFFGSNTLALLGQARPGLRRIGCRNEMQVLLHYPNGCTVDTYFGRKSDVGQENGP